MQSSDTYQSMSRRYLKAACEQCGESDRLEAHHSNKNRRDNSEENIVTLCHSCHLAQHKHKPGSSRIWNQTEDALRAAKSVAEVMRATGEIPAPLADAYRKSLLTATPGLVQRFYERLAMECPEALRYFTDAEMARPLAGQKEE